MSTVGRLKQGNLLLAGEIEERVPTVKNGLVAHFPFDHTEKGRSFRNLLDPSSWTVGTTGSGNGWSMNGNNLVTTYTTPFEYEDTVLSVTVPDTVSGYEGGWTNYSKPIDNTKLYRLSVWIRRENVGDGRTYFGCQGSTVCNLTTTDGTVNSNPYFAANLASEVPKIQDGWTLWVAHIHPHSYTGATHPDSGIYDIAGTKVSSVSDFKWSPTATVGGHRSYLYYSSSLGERQYWYAPRMEMSHGSQCTIAELVKGWDDFHQATVNQHVTFAEEGAGVEIGTTNLLPKDLALGGVILPTNNAAFTVSSVSTERAYVGKSSILGTQVAVGGQRGFYTTWYNASPNLPYSASCYVYTEMPITYSVYIAHNTPGGSVTTKTNSITTVPNTWTRLFVDNGIAPADASHVRLIVSGSTVPIGTKAYFDAFQIEQKPHSTSFTPDNRSGSGTVRIDNLGGFTNYTVTGTFYPRTPLDATYDFTASSASMLRIEDVVNTGGFYYRYYVSGSSSRPYMDNDGIYGGDHNHTTLTVQANKELFYAITKSGSTVRMKVYQEGALLGEHTNTTAGATARLDSIVFGDTTIWNGSHKNISIYNRVLADVEITKLAKGSFSMTKQGGLLSSVKEYDSIMLIEEESRNVADNTYGSTGTWTIIDKDLSRFVEGANELGAVYFTGEVYLSSTTYYPRTLEFTKENNTKGINQVVVEPNGGWKVGWNTIFFKANSYVDALNTPWADMSRLEIYRSGPTAGADAAQYFTLKNIQLVKVAEYGKWMRNKKNKLHTIQIKEGKVL